MKKIKKITQFNFLIFTVLLCFSCNNENKIAEFNDCHFRPLETEKTGVYFSNEIIEPDNFNFNDPYFYMGGGVAIGDINNDGLSDVFFTGNMVENKLYLNKGGMQFEDIGLSAGITGDERWYTGVTMADVNNDGWIDIYVCVSGMDGNTKNQLYINNGDLTFIEKAEEYGIADSTPSIQATFFDYNNDELIDLFVGNYPQVSLSMGNKFYYNEMKKNDPELSGHLYKNNGNGFFQDVTKEAGVQNFGLAIGVVATDLNNDGWKDLYISNDFNVPDYLYINNGDSTFSEKIKESTGHTSFFGMGLDASDFNNDGWIDLFQTDMVPEDYKRALLNLSNMKYKSFSEGVELGFHYQYMTNSFQLNNGVTDNGTPIFSEISRFTDTYATDWSWSTLFMDMNNDGWKDIFITNGIKRDINNNDIIHSEIDNPFNNKRKKLSDYPSKPVANYAFRNNSNLSFTNVTKEWGLGDEGFSNGAAYGDLDNDGDLDIIINNIDEAASIIENEANKYGNRYLKIKLIGSEKNTLGLGTKITIKSYGIEQTQELTLSRGFQSSVEPIIHFGLGDIELISDINVQWPDGKVQVLKNVNSNQLLKVFYKDAKVKPQDNSKTPVVFKDITTSYGIDFEHIEDVFDDLEREPLLPHMNSKLGPPLTVGDVNGDGYEDFFVGNAKGAVAAMYLQLESGEFIKMKGPWEQDSNFEDTGVLLFDADNDNDLDLYVVSGGNNLTGGDKYYQDRLYVNTQNGFVKSNSALPLISSSGSQVVPGDYDGDGDLDLFVCGRISPGIYPLPAKSYILRNEGGKDEEIRYKDVTEEIAPELMSAGLVTSAVWSDLNNDNLPELIITGEWMPIRFFENEDGKFVEITDEVGLKNTEGWWYSLKEVDIDNDGDKDFIAGNLGLNYDYKASETSPFEIYLNDFDEDDHLDIVLSYNGLPVRGREYSSIQVPAIQQRFKTYEAFANADMAEIYGEGMLMKSFHYKANTFANCWIENKGNQKFVMHQLPRSAQLSSINSIEVFDYNNDQYLDLLVAGNLYNSGVETIRNDAGIGLVLLGDAKGDFIPVPAFESGVMILGEVKSTASIKLGKSGNQGFLFGVNNSKLKLISKNNSVKIK
ncbi:VCBS repeat-containing protein [Lutibacter citreus]|uniref:VCBS repeat-containing protein n=1 Tax=Lutibacter citreus TaxID=2138210 RepID=UPI000DBE9076|nr:VCBS repeat-containing protein [Lutibacter citreus]